jgi:hypothetical protein
VHYAPWDDYALLGSEANRVSFQVDQELPFKTEEKLVIVFMLVPVIFEMDPVLGTKG